MEPVSRYRGIPLKPVASGHAPRSLEQTPEHPGTSPLLWLARLKCARDENALLDQIRNTLPPPRAAIQWLVQSLLYDLCLRVDEANGVRYRDRASCNLIIPVFFKLRIQSMQEMVFRAHVLGSKEQNRGHVAQDNQFINIFRRPFGVD